MRHVRALYLDIDKDTQAKGKNEANSNQNEEALHYSPDLRRRITSRPMMIPSSAEMTLCACNLLQDQHMQHHVSRVALQINLTDRQMRTHEPAITIRAARYQHISRAR